MYYWTMKSAPLGIKIIIYLKVPVEFKFSPAYSVKEKWRIVEKMQTFQETAYNLKK